MAGLVSKLAGGGGQEEEREAELQSRWEIDQQPDPTCKSNSKLSDHLPSSAKLVYRYSSWFSFPPGCYQVEIFWDV